MTTWILVANRSTAQLFEYDFRDRTPRLLRSFFHPEGRLRSQDLDSDRPGRSFDRHGSGRHAMGTEVDPQQHHAEVFARELISTLEHGRAQELFSSLVLVAEPQFLGLLRGNVDPPLERMIHTSFGKDLAGQPLHELEERLAALIAA